MTAHLLEINTFALLVCVFFPFLFIFYANNVIFVQLGMYSQQISFNVHRNISFKFTICFNDKNQTQIAESWQKHITLFILWVARLVSCSTLIIKLFIISHHAEGPGREILKRPPSVCLSDCPSVTFSFAL